jgi:hypothetical protein
MTLRYFLMYQGYAADQSWACLLFAHEDGFEEPLAAMQSFRAALEDCVKARWRTPYLCCEQMPEDANYCSNCGQSRHFTEVTDGDTSSVFIELINGILDGTHDWEEILQDYGWFRSAPLVPEETCMVVNVDVWLENPDDYMEVNLPNGKTWTTRDA